MAGTRAGRVAPAAFLLPEAPGSAPAPTVAASSALRTRPQPGTRGQPRERTLSILPTHLASRESAKLRPSARIAQEMPATARPGGVRTRTRARASRSRGWILSLMLRYHLDDLGWYQFEWLVQSILKADLGLGVESWSSPRGDHGRDAYFDGELAFPAKVATHGPFVFQVKFVENANAKGSDPVPALIAAVRKEAGRIRKRRSSLLSSWETPAHYALVTNAPLEVSTREAIAALLADAMPGTTVTTLGAADVGSLLDLHPTLRRSFPQILSLRDLDTLLAEAVSHELIERSRAAIDASRDLVRVFVPTASPCPSTATRSRPPTRSRTWR